MAADEDIRFVTYLSPSIPQAIFEALADHVQRALGHVRVSLRVESQSSGPQKGGECSTFADEADVAFMCAPSFVWLRDMRPPPVELLGVLLSCAVSANVFSFGAHLTVLEDIAGTL